ncbi:hypothetical protein [Actinokineospora enzanensis]|uniref:hypothetical protein n=1 Tax=Actinokineospora enzanensis TaxID=155975 RepID=UPI000378B1FB|nr:hypothetical protein [Actinokineospora enzanensis]
MVFSTDTEPDDPGQGRHRAGLPRPPRVRRRGARAHARPLTDEDTDVLPVIGAMVHVDGPATGLAKFDLGTIPASVTPPRSWRHAAWFAVTAAILVVVGLAYAAVTLMSGPRRPDMIEALPGLSNIQPLPMTDLPAADAPSLAPKPGEPRPTDPAPGSPDDPTASPTAAVPAPGDSGTAPADADPADTGDTPAGQGDAVAVTSGASRPDRPAVAGPSAQTPAARSTVVTPMLVVPPNDATTMGDRTEAFFRAVVIDPGAAFDMTTGPLRYAGQDQFCRRFADVTRIDVQKIVIDPSRARTRSMVRLVHRDGSVSSEVRELTFSYGDDPRISAEKTAS